MGALLFVTAHVLLHPVAAKVAITAVKVVGCVGGAMLFDHIVLGD